MAAKFSEEAAAGIDLPALLAGDRRQLHNFIVIYSPLFHSVVHSILAGQTGGDMHRDLVQDVVLALLEDEKQPFRALRAWRRELGMSLKTFLARFAHFRVIDRLRSRAAGSNRTTLVGSEELARLAGSDPTSPLCRQDREDYAVLMNVANRVLSPTDLHFFGQAFVEERPTAELVELWQTTPAAIHQRRSRVRAALVRGYYEAVLDRGK
jgi:RNA polymerase sigma factor (sigma-70 family)